MTRPSKQVLAISNSAALFVEPWEPPLLAQYLIELTCVNRPVICHVGAANGDSPEKTGRFFALAQRAGFEPRHLNLFALENGDPASFFAGVDAIYLDGGSTRNLRAILREWSADIALRRAYDNDVVISGASAGANILFEWGMTDSIKTRIEATQGLGLLQGTVSVHANVRSDRNHALRRHLASPDARHPAYALDDCTALHFRDGTLCRSITTQSDAFVHCETGDGEMVRQPAMMLTQMTGLDTI